MRNRIISILVTALVALMAIGMSSILASPAAAPTERPGAIVAPIGAVIPQAATDTPTPTLTQTGIITSNPTVRLGVPTGVRFKRQGATFYALIDTSVIFHKPGLEVMLKRPVTIWVDIANISSDALTIQALKADLLAKADAHLRYQPLTLTNVVLEANRTRLIISDEGVLESVLIQVNVEVQLVAIGTITNALEVAFTGATQPDGTVLWGERVRATVEGMIFTSMDPATDPLLDILEDIRTNALSVFSSL